MAEIPREIGQCASAVRADVIRVQNALRELAGLVQGERVEALLAEARVALMGATAECNKIDSLMGAGRAAGQVSKPPRASGDEQQLILASLHRIGDHTLDPDEEEEVGG